MITLLRSVGADDMLVHYDAHFYNDYRDVSSLPKRSGSLMVNYKGDRKDKRYAEIDIPLLSHLLAGYYNLREELTGRPNPDLNQSWFEITQMTLIRFRKKNYMKNMQRYGSNMVSCQYLFACDRNRFIRHREHLTKKFFI